MESANPFRKELPLFSVISPCYGEDWKNLGKAFKALESQEYPKWEWVVVFDGKSRGAAKMEEIIAKHKDRKVSYYTIKHSGAPDARNFGASKAEGEYLSFLDADDCLYPETLRMWANGFEDNSINRVWGLYDLDTLDGLKMPVGQAPCFPSGKIWYSGFKFCNYCDSGMPIRKSAFIPWEDLPALQDWDWAQRQLKRDNFEGKDWLYIPHSFYLKADVKEGGISQYSHTHWWELTRRIRDKNGIPFSDICVCSLGAAHHGFHAAEKLGADYLPMPSFKEHHYKKIYLLGFYTAEDPQNPIVTKAHLDVFANNKGKNILHWIGSDVLQLRWNCSFEKVKELKKIWKANKVIHLTEFKPTHDELLELGIKTKILPIPCKKIYETMPLPEEFTVGIYESNKNPMYNKEFMDDIVRNMPDVKFIYFGEDENKGTKGKNYEHVGYITDIIERCSLNLRVSVHDGLPLLPIEFMMAGRQVITNVPIKGATIVSKDRKEVIEAIRSLRKNTLNPKWSKYWRKEMNFKKYLKRIGGL